MIPYGTSSNGVPATRFSDPAPIIQPTGSDVSAPQIYGGSNTLFTHQIGILIQGKTPKLAELARWAIRG